MLLRPQGPDFGLRGRSGPAGPQLSGTTGGGSPARQSPFLLGEAEVHQLGGVDVGDETALAYFRMKLASSVSPELTSLARPMGSRVRNVQTTP